MKKFILLLIMAALQVHCLFGQSSTDKIKGISLESPPIELNAEDFHTLSSTNANWMAVIPYGFSFSDNPTVYFNSERQWWGERLEGASRMVNLAKKNGYKVMMKPQVWIPRDWVGNYGLDTEEEWEEWEESYKEFVITFARCADSLEVEIFCLGTEFKIATDKRPGYWLNLIDSVRSVYRGKITYAANWDEYQNINFWDKLDFIGVDAYFPLTDKNTPDISELLHAWVPHKLKMKALSDSLGIPLLLTEFGYRSVNGAAGKQWELSEMPLNLEVQRRAYIALFESLWGESWIRGGFVWKWQFNEGAGGREDRRYTPQGKPAMDLLRKIYE